ncbi:Aminoglycoside phosphotransferase [Penicillium concentricum]|uniref:Aminoglycoside phosphotransferase n=1 Tax=Penicillium concentricum TaxID=293559 RepID=A0A9W9RBS9_9EURO|nr:Aminoglycoside phosphotransferase [Penicillium concentricum]KAJ5356625.1 Aminoglycoside phosphotransferase [Penicillium concentricum]
MQSALWSFERETFQGSTYHTTPRIIAYNATRESEIGFEWILMTEVSGKPLADLWQCLSIAAKSDLVKKFAGFSISLWRNQLKGIGNIYPLSVTADEKASTGEPAASGSPEHLMNAVPKTGQIVSLEFLWGSHTRQNVNRGPFLSSQEWMEARLAFAKNDCHDAEDELGATTRTLGLIEKLETIFPRIFPRDKYVPELSVVFHDDLSQNNILVSKKGELTGVLDWECVSALPLWKACFYPTFLHGRPRDTKPNIEKYDRGNPPSGGAYWEHLHDYEVTLLRGVFLDEMRKSEPTWVNVFDTSRLRRDFDTAVQHFDSGIVRHIIEKWVEDVTAGNENPQNLRDSLGC